MCVEKVADKNGHAMAQLQVLTDSRAPQVEIAVFHTQIVTPVGVVLNSKRRYERRAKYTKLLGCNLNVAGINLGILALAFSYRSLYLDAIFASQLVCLVTESLVVGLVEDKLGDAIAVAKVHKGHAPHFTSALHPSGKCNLFTDIGQTQLSTSVSSIHIM